MQFQTEKARRILDYFREHGGTEQLAEKRGRGSMKTDWHQEAIAHLEGVRRMTERYRGEVAAAHQQVALGHHLTAAEFDAASPGNNLMWLEASAAAIEERVDVIKIMLVELVNSEDSENWPATAQ